MRIHWGSHLTVGGIALMTGLIPGPATAQIVPVSISMQIIGTNSLCSGSLPCCSACDNWISLPFINTYVGGGISQLCDSNGDGLITSADSIQLVSIQGKTISAGVYDLNYLGGTITHNCLLPFTDDPPYTPTRSVRLRPKIGLSPLISYSGDHDYSVDWLVRATLSTGGTCTSAVCDNWLDVPYVTAADNIRDFCDSNGDGIVSSADAVSLVTIQGQSVDLNRMDTLTTHNCALAFSQNPIIPIGRSVRLRLKSVVSDTLMTPP